MSFREKSAWAMGALLLVAGAVYITLIASAGAPPATAAIVFVLIAIVGSIATQVILAIASPGEALTPADERERQITDKAGHFASYVLASGVVVGLGQFIVTQDGSKMFHIVLTCLILSQIAEYGAQILFFRRSV
ncbi:hypothetical protein [Sphingomonas sp.]|uniref:hypothetical protein n=1 Tax=Sphingomonas sp. TaxID=28214 RepID=UPI00286C4AB2|nr:hypothetical protein [Sphingomonas sp.]